MQLVESLFEEMSPQSDEQMSVSSGATKGS